MIFFFLMNFFHFFFFFFFFLHLTIILRNFQMYLKCLDQIFRPRKYSMFFTYHFSIEIRELN
jgi:hypothetical protein